jgi:hypothetical protein
VDYIVEKAHLVEEAVHFAQFGGFVGVGKICEQALPGCEAAPGGFTVGLAELIDPGLTEANAIVVVGHKNKAGSDGQNQQKGQQHAKCGTGAR